MIHKQKSEEAKLHFSKVCDKRVWKCLVRFMRCSSPAYRQAAASIH